jgi:hypothetical protein
VHDSIHTFKAPGNFGGVGDVAYDQLESLAQPATASREIVIDNDVVAGGG